MTNTQVRSWYLSEISKIAELDRRWAQRGDTLEQRAHQAWQQRHDLRLRAREMLKNPVDVEMLRERDRGLYSNPDGPTFEDLVRNLRSRGLTADEAFRLILSRAQKTSEEVNRLMSSKEPGEPPTP